jgi:hypothetical protein
MTHTQDRLAEQMREMAQQALREVERDIRGYREAFRLIPEGKRRQGVPVGTWAHVRQYLNCRIARLETARMLCDWFARGAQPAYMDWERDVQPYLG